MADSILDPGSKEDNFRQKKKELDSETINHINKVKQKAQDLRDEMLNGGKTELVEKALDKINEAVFWLTYART